MANKFLYYEGAKYKLKPISDAEYDKIEDEYRHLAKELKLPPTAADMVGFDESRPSCQLVAQHLIATHGRGTPKEVQQERNVFIKQLKKEVQKLGASDDMLKLIKVMQKKFSPGRGD